MNILKHITASIIILCLVSSAFAQKDITLHTLHHTQSEQPQNSHYYFYTDNPYGFFSSMVDYFEAPLKVSENQHHYTWGGYGPSAKLWYTEFVLFEVEWTEVPSNPDITKGTIKAIGKYSKANYMHHRWGFVANFFEEIIQNM